MGMVHGSGNAVPFHGDHHPVGIYVGDQPVFEPTDQAQDGKTLTFENTYNDTADVTVFGESTQDGEPTPEAPVPIESIKSVELVSIGRNLLAYTDTFDINNYYKSNGEEINGEVCQNMLGKLSAVKTKKAWIGAGFNPMPVFERGNVKPGDLLTYSVWFMCDFEPEKNMSFSMYRFNSKDDLSKCVGLGSTAKIYKKFGRTMQLDYSDIHHGKWYRLWYTFVVPDDLSGVRNTRIESDYYTTSNYMFGTNGESIYFAGLMLEKGSKPHEFEPYRYSSRTIDLQGHELRSLPDGTHDELLVHRDGTVELVQRCDASMFDPSHHVSNEWKLATPQTIQLPSIDPLPTYHPYTFVDGNGAEISARVKVFE